MYNQGNMRLHVDLFIKYVSNNGQFYIDITNNWTKKTVNKAEKSIFLTFFSSLYFITTFCGLFSI